MAHLHIPDGVLPLWLWGPAWVLVALGFALTWRGQQRRSPQRIAYEGALGALMLAAMALEVPLGPVEYHLTLAGPIGVLLGPAGALQAAFIASALLAFVGHGGVTLIALNTLLLATAALTASALYPLFAARRSGAVAMAGATAGGHLLSGLLWWALVLGATRWRAQALGLSGEGVRLIAVSALALPMVVLGIGAESAAALGMGRFLARVRPDLIPGPVTPRRPVEP